MKTIKVGQLLLVAVLSQGVVACLNSSGGGMSVEQLRPTPTPTPDNSVEEETPNLGSPIVDEETPVNPAEPRVDSQSAQQASSDGYEISLFGANLELVQEVRLRKVDANHMTLVPNILSQSSSEIRISTIGIMEDTAYFVDLVLSPSQSIETKKVILNSKRAAQIATSGSSYASGTVSVGTEGCIVMQDTSLRCVGKGMVTQFQGTRDMVSGSAHYDFQFLFGISSNNHPSWNSLKVQVSNTATSYAIRDRNNNPVVNVAEVAVLSGAGEAFDQICFRKRDNTVYCYGSYGQLNKIMTQAAFSSVEASDALLLGFISPRQILNTDGSAYKATSLARHGNRICSVEEGTNYLHCMKAVNNMSAPEQVVKVTQTNQAPIVVSGGLSTGKYPQDASGKIYDATGTLLQVDGNEMQVKNASGTSTTVEVMSAVFKSGASNVAFAISQDKMKVYSCDFTYFKVCEYTPIYSAANNAEKILDAKANALNFCIRDNSNRIKCLGSKTFEGGELMTTVDTSKTFMNFVGKDQVNSKQASLVTPAWDIGMMEEVVLGNEQLMFWGTSNSGDNTIYWANSSTTSFDKANFLQKIEDSKNIANIVKVFSFKPAPIVHDNSIPSL